MRRILAASAAFAITLGGSHARALTVGVTNDPNTLAGALHGSVEAITILSAAYAGAAAAAGTYQDGPLGIADGVLLTTGKAKAAMPPNDSDSTGTSNGLPGHPGCDALIPGYSSHDASRLVIEFTLAPGYDGISFQSVFGTEEFPEYVGSTFNDVYAVYLDGDQIVFDEDGFPITINGPFFSSGNVVVGASTGSEYDGSTGLLTTRAEAATGSHVLEIIICDAGDFAYDSGVFLANLSGCKGDDCSGTAPCELVDGDSDGVSSCDDCDDSNRLIHPGAKEVCDGIDNDCDGQVDEGGVCCVDADKNGLCDEADVGGALPTSTPAKKPTLNWFLGLGLNKPKKK